MEGNFIKGLKFGFGLVVVFCLLMIAEVAYTYNIRDIMQKSFDDGVKACQASQRR